MNDLAWAAGLMDGDGCFTMAKKQSRPTTILTMVNYETVLRFKNIVKVGSIALVDCSKYENHRNCTKHQSDGDGAILIAKLLFPYLFTKRCQAQLIIEWSQIKTEYESINCGGRQLTTKTIAQREILYDEMRLLNARGNHATSN